MNVDSQRTEESSSLKPVNSESPLEIALARCVVVTLAADRGLLAFAIMMALRLRVGLGGDSLTRALGTLIRPRPCGDNGVRG